MKCFAGGGAASKKNKEQKINDQILVKNDGFVNNQKTVSQNGNVDKKDKTETRLNDIPNQERANGTKMVQELEQVINIDHKIEKTNPNNLNSEMRNPKSVLSFDKEALFASSEIGMDPEVIKSIKISCSNDENIVLKIPGYYIKQEILQMNEDIILRHLENENQFEEFLTLLIDQKDMNISLSARNSEKKSISTKDIEQVCHEHWAKVKSMMVNLEPPTEYRWRIWYSVGKNFTVKFDLDGYYALVDAASTDLSIQVEMDVGRTFVDHPFFKDTLNNHSNSGSMKLSRLGKAVGVYFKRIGYTQGMNLVLGFLLICSNGNELESFNLYVYLMKNRRTQLYSFNEDYFTFITFLCFVLKRKLKEFLPNTHEIIISELKLPDELWMTKWFISMFGGFMPHYYTARFMDGLLFEDVFSIVDIALSIVKKLFIHLMNLSFSEVGEYVRDIEKNPLLISEHPNSIIDLKIDFKKNKKYIIDCMVEFMQIDGGCHRERFKKYYSDFLIYLQDEKGGALNNYAVKKNELAEQNGRVDNIFKDGNDNIREIYERNVFEHNENIRLDEVVMSVYDFQNQILKEPIVQ